MLRLNYHTDWLVIRYPLKDWKLSSAIFSSAFFCLLVIYIIIYIFNFLSFGSYSGCQITCSLIRRRVIRRLIKIQALCKGYYNYGFYVTVFQRIWGFLSTIIQYLLHSQLLSLLSHTVQTLSSGHAIIKHCAHICPFWVQTQAAKILFSFKYKHKSTGMWFFR